MIFIFKDWKFSNLYNLIRHIGWGHDNVHHNRMAHLLKNLFDCQHFVSPSPATGGCSFVSSPSCSPASLSARELWGRGKERGAARVRVRTKPVWWSLERSHPIDLRNSFVLNVHRHTVNVLSALPLQCLDVLLSVRLSEGSKESGGVNMDCVHTLLLFMEKRLDRVRKSALNCIVFLYLRTWHL